MVGLEDGLLPLYWGIGPPDAVTMAEERRLCYVGMTRARDQLILSRAERRTLRGRVRESAPSPFLRDIEEALLRREQTVLKYHGPKDTQLTLL